MQELIEGRIVHYVPENTDLPGQPGWHRAAIVNMVYPGGREVCLTVFDPDKTYIAICVKCDPTAQKPDSWHWIEVKE